MLYFAYGSNMDPAQMAERCPESFFVALGCLKGYRLCFPRKSIKRNCGVASVEPMVENEVWGVVFEISENDLRKLDKPEGYNPYKYRQENSYVREEVDVIDDNNRLLHTWIYSAIPQPTPPLPNKTYLNMIINAARQIGLPKDYIRKLESIPTE